MQTPLFHEKLLDFCRSRRLCDDFALLYVLLSIYRQRGDCPFLSERLREETVRSCLDDEIAVSATFLAQYLGFQHLTVQRHIGAFCSMGLISKIRQSRGHSIFRIERALAEIAKADASDLQTQNEAQTKMQSVCENEGKNDSSKLIKSNDENDQIEQSSRARVYN